MADAISQNDIDSLFANLGGGAPAEDASPASQDDIDALFSSLGPSSATPPPAPPAASTALAAPAAPAEDLAIGPVLSDAMISGEGAASQDDIDALFAQVSAGVPMGEISTPAPNIDPPPATGGGPMAPDDIDAMFAKLSPPPAAAPVPAPAAEIPAAPMPPPIEPEVPPAAPVAAMPPPAPASAAPIPQPRPPESSPAVSTAPLPMPPPIFSPPPPPRQAVETGGAGARESLSLVSGAGEVEGLAGQIASLLGSLSERARRFQGAWLASDQEARELRNRLADEDHRRAVLETEKAAFREEADALRRQIGKVEGQRLAGEESHRTEIHGRDTRLREAESRIELLGGEADALREELVRARREATAADLESRRTRFEADRLRGEIESERMERLRIQRALENREKELQAFQAQQSGQATTLFLDELHRLVRRLESELDVRTAAAHEALAILDRLPLPDAAVALASNLRAALMAAAGHAAEGEDALRMLSREAAGPRGTAAIVPPPGAADMNAFEAAIAGYDLGRAADLAAELFRRNIATPAALMKKVYLCGSLRRAETADHLPALAKLLEALRTVQQSRDHALGREGPEAEGMYVRMFDFLHNLVRLKIVTRATGEMWRLFLDLRGRFSFASSDKEWARYRDDKLGGPVEAAAV